MGGNPLEAGAQQGLTEQLKNFIFDSNSSVIDIFLQSLLPGRQGRVVDTSTSGTGKQLPGHKGSNQRQGEQQAHPRGNPVRP